MCMDAKILFATSAALTQATSRLANTNACALCFAPHIGFEELEATLGVVYCTADLSTRDSCLALPVDPKSP